MSAKSVKNWIELEEVLAKAKKTRVWNVRNKRTGQNCGTIKWWGAWRKYCFFPTNDFLFDADCLRLIAAECEIRTGEHYQFLKVSRET